MPARPVRRLRRELRLARRRLCPHGRWPAPLTRLARLFRALRRAPVFLHRLLIPAGCAAALLLPPLAGAAQEPAPAAGNERILLLMSYHPGLPWSDDQLAGVRRVLAAERPGSELRVEYLDSKHIQPSPAYYAQLESLFASKYGSAPPSLLLASDDDALDFALQLRAAHFPDRPILFSGIAESRQAELALHRKLSGVFDDEDIARNVALMLGLLPKTKRLVFIHDQSRSSLAQAESLHRLAPQYPEQSFEFVTGLSVADVQARLRALDADDLVFLLTFNRDAAGRVLTHEESTALWVAAARSPLVASKDINMRPGVLGGRQVTGRQQGEALGRLALRVLRGEAAERIPPQRGAATPTFNHDALQRWGIAPAALPAGTVVLGAPPPLSETIRPHLAWLLVLIGCLLLIIALLAAAIRTRQRSLAAQRASETTFRTLVEHAPDAIIVIDAFSGRIVDANRNAEQLFGLPRADLLQQPLADLSAPRQPDGRDVRECAADYARQTLAGQTPTFEWLHRRADGSDVPCEVRLVRLPGNDARPLIRGSLTDITERKAAAAEILRERNFLETLLDATPTPIYYKDRAGRYLGCNAAFLRLSGLAREQIIGRTVFDLAPPALAQAHAARDAALYAAAGRQIYETRITDADGGERDVAFHKATFNSPHGEVAGLIGVIIDLTEVKRAQLALQELNQELEARVAARGRELHLAMGQLVQSEKLAALGSLVAGIAHELNTPLGNVLTVASTLRDETARFGERLLSGNIRRSEVSAATETLREAGELIERNAARAAKLIADFKQVAVDQSSARRRRFDLAEVLNEMLSTLHPLLGRSGHVVCLDVPEGIEMNSYPGPLEQIVTNFVTNSLNHGFEHTAAGHISLSARREGERVLFRYADNGCGIAESALGHLFDPFFTTKLGQGGSGLGLYIVYNLVTGVLGGRIDVRSAPGAGTEFTLDLPLAAPTAAEAEGAKADAG